MASYTIKDLEKLSGIKAHTIRIWEKRYGLIEPQRTSTNIRTYCDLDLKRLLNISFLNRHGLKISKIAQLTPEQVKDKIGHLQQNMSDLESHIESLSIAMIDLDEDKFEKILSRLVIQMGFEDAFIKIIYPFFGKVGIMWLTGAINPAQEHFVSNLIRQKLNVAIDSQIASNNSNQKSFLLFLPEGELHELGLLFYAYLIKKRGYKIIYLGQSVPLNDLFDVIKLRPCNYLVTSFISTFNGQSVYDYALEISENARFDKLFISGNQATEIDSGKLPPKVNVVASPIEFIEILDNLLKANLN
ncbi:MAG: MerR family transcriptional regulator [Bacteroidales bacterium]